MSKRKAYFKVRQQTCPNCKKPREVVVKGITNGRGKEMYFTERIVGIDCKKCGLQQLINPLIIC